MKLFWCCTAAPPEPHLVVLDVSTLQFVVPNCLSAPRKEGACSAMHVLPPQEGDDYIWAGFQTRKCSSKRMLWRSFRTQWNPCLDAGTCSGNMLLACTPAITNSSIPGLEIESSSSGDLAPWPKPFKGQQHVLVWGWALRVWWTIVGGFVGLFSKEIVAEEIVAESGALLALQNSTTEPWAEHGSAIVSFLSNLGNRLKWD